jgi:O-antigen/teichoic acid export membrane protein
MTHPKPGTHNFVSTDVSPQIQTEEPLIRAAIPRRHRLYRLTGSRNRRVTSTLVLTQAAVAVVAVIVNVVSARLMGPSGRGELALYLQLAYLVGSLSMIGIDRAYIAAHKSTFTQAISHQVAILRPVMWFWVPASLAALGTASAASSNAVVLTLAGILMCSGSLSYKILGTAYISSARSALYAWITLSMQLLLIAGAGLAIVGNINGTAPWLGLYGLSTTPSIVVVFACWRKHNVTKLDRTEVRRIRGFGVRLLPASIGNTAMLRSDRLLLPVLASTRELGLYVVVATVMELTAWPVKNYVDATLWQWRRRVQTGSLQVARYAISAAISTAVVAAIAALGVSLIIIKFLGHAYSSSIPLVIPLGIASVFYAVSRVLQGALVAHGAGGRASASEVSGMLISIAAYIALIPSMGALGAALGSAVGYGGCCAVTAGLLQKEIRSHSRSSGKDKQ